MRVSLNVMLFMALMLVGSIANASDLEILNKVNRYWNYSIKQSTDMEVWGVEDYWATPEETLAKGAGDCEDFAIAKMFHAMDLGVSPDKLRLEYVLLSHLSGKKEAHMVLAYYATPKSEPLYLDNVMFEIRTSGQRRDLEPVFSLAFDGVYVNNVKRASVASASKWGSLLTKVKGHQYASK